MGIKAADQNIISGGNGIHAAGGYGVRGSSIKNAHVLRENIYDREQICSPYILLFVS
jgi:hypothetical protein